MTVVAARPARPFLAEFPELWRGLPAHGLRVQRCRDCGALRYPPSPVCDQCLGPESDWQPVRGTGRIASWVRFARRYLPEWEPPYHVCAAELPEGLLVVADLAAPAGTEIRIGAPVTLEVVEVADPAGRYPSFRWRLDPPEPR
jgi:uncharacterized OB-fold protein